MRSGKIKARALPTERAVPRDVLSRMVSIALRTPAPVLHNQAGDCADGYSDQIPIVASQPQQIRIERSGRRIRADSDHRLSAD
jgi:hypothetical protein